VTPDDKTRLIDLLSHMKQQLNDISIKD